MGLAPAPTPIPAPIPTPIPTPRTADSSTSSPSGSSSDPIIGGESGGSTTGFGGSTSGGITGIPPKGSGSGAQTPADPLTNPMGAQVISVASAVTRLVASPAGALIELGFNAQQVLLAGVEASQLGSNGNLIV